MKVRSAWARGAVATVALGGFVLASSGCISLDGVVAEQPDRIGDLTIHGTVCLSGSTGCSGQDNIDFDVPAFSGQGQLLVGYRVPPGITAPASLSSDSPTTTLAANAGYAAELERLSPAGPGRVWVGYVTNTLVVNGAVDPNIAVTARFGLPQGADGSPFAGPVGYRAVAGFRLVDATHPADRPVNCGANITDVMPDSTVCIDAPLATTVAGDDAVFGTRDLGIITGAKASGLAGTTVTVPTVTGEEALEIRPGTQFGDQYVIRGKGFPALQGRARGDQRVLVEVQIPKVASPEAREAVERLADTLDDRAYRHDTGFFDRLKHAFR